jgi:hypothetical protein
MDASETLFSRIKAIIRENPAEKAIEELKKKGLSLTLAEVKEFQERLAKD